MKSFLTYKDLVNSFKNGELDNEVCKNQLVVYYYQNNVKNCIPISDIPKLIMLNDVVKHYMMWGDLTKNNIDEKKNKLINNDKEI